MSGSDTEAKPGSAGPAGASFGRRLGRAVLSFVVAWTATGVLWILWSQPWRATPVGGTRWADDLWFILLVGGFAAIGWIAVVLPLIRLGDHAGWFFDHRAAPLIGFVCGVAILLVESAVFFDYPPWQVVDDLGDPGTRDLLLWAGAFGAVLWWHYTRAVGRVAGPARSSDPA